MNELPKSIVEFLKNNKTATIAFVNENKEPYCISAFFAFLESKAYLIFKSAAGTTHYDLTKQGASTAGTVLPDKLEVLKLQGIQFKGTILSKTEAEASDSSCCYYKKHPMSLAIPGYLWSIQVDWIKFTDNTKGFGHKTIWNRV